LYCSTHGDEALVGRVTVNAIFLGILIAVSPFLFIFALSNITIRCCCEAPSQRARATRLLLAFLFCSFAEKLFYDKGRVVRKAELVSGEEDGPQFGSN
jgi:hypothetical protein